MMVLEQIEEWRLHIGAHKTATTHLQDSLELYRPLLRENQLDYFPRALVRSVRPWPKNGFLGARVFLQDGNVHSSFDRALEALRSGPARIILSEENLLGKPEHLLTPELYPEAEQRLARLNRLGAKARLSVFVSTRSFDQLLPSAYAQILRGGARTGGFDAIRKRALTSPPSWADLVSRVSRALPNAHLQVWTFEDYCQSPPDIMSHFCGIDLPRSETLPVPAGTRSPSAHAIAEIESIQRQISKNRRKAAVKAIIADDRSTEKFRPFDPDEAAFLRDAYDKDLAALEKDMPGAFLRPRQSEDAIHATSTKSKLVIS